MTKEKIDEKLKKSFNAGHRQRVRDKFLACRDALRDYEILEMMLFLAFSRKDTRNLSKMLIKKFKTLDNIINADVDQLKDVEGIGSSVICVLKLFQEVHLRLLKDNIKDRGIKITGVEDVIKYCRAKIGHLVHEEVLVLFLNNNNKLVCESVINVGSVDEVNVYKNLIITRATQNGSSGIIMVHNHPSGTAKPSTEDIELTIDVKGLLKQVGMELLDHVIVSGTSSYSFARNGLI